MLRRMPLFERMEPIQKEIGWVISGRPNAKHHKKVLPEYCYHIFELQRRTIFQPLSPLSDLIKFKNKKRGLKAKTIVEAKKSMVIEWEKLGAVFAIGDRCRMFYENELEQKIKQEGLSKLTKKHEVDFVRLICGERWIERKIAELKAIEASKPVEEILADKFFTTAETTKKAIPEWHQKACEWSPEAVTKFHGGIAKGSDGFLDQHGNLKGEKKIKLRETYEFLLLAWPEIQAMAKAVPPNSRNDLWELLKPFSYARWIEIQDLEQLNRLCNEIKLKLKKPGAPFKAK